MYGIGLLKRMENTAFSDCNLWKYNIPPKVRIFGWKIFHGFIPVEMQLKIYHVPTNGDCWSCRKDGGSIKHTLILCDIVNSALPKDVLQEIFARLELDQAFLISVFHVRRSANRIAHGLATFSGTISTTACWIDN